MKQCSKCLATKELGDFYKKTATTYRGICKSCWNSQTKRWVENNPERRKEILNKSDRLHVDVRSQSARTYREANVPRALWRAAKNRAQKMGLPFDLTPDDIEVPQCCPVFGYPLAVNSGTPGGKFNSPSLDRKIPGLGYVRGNIQVISYQANMMKSYATPDELRTFANWISKQT